MEIKSRETKQKIKPKIDIANILMPRVGFSDWISFLSDINQNVHKVCLREPVTAFKVISMVITELKVRLNRKLKSPPQIKGLAL